MYTGGGCAASHPVRTMADESIASNDVISPFHRSSSSLLVNDSRASVVSSPAPAAATEPLHAGTPSQRTDSLEAKGP